jgi:hypothetical protein
MKARIRDGKVLGGDRATIPISSHLCECYDCINDTCTDVFTGLLRPGRWVDKETLAKHDSLARSRGIASARSAAAAIGITIPTFISPSPPMLDNVLNQHLDTRNAGYSTSLNDGDNSAPQSSYLQLPTKLDEAGARARNTMPVRHHSDFRIAKASAMQMLLAMKNLKTRLEVGPQFNSFKSVVFKKSPTSQSLPVELEIDDVWALQSQVAANTQILAHQAWLVESLAFVSDGRKQYGSHSTELRLLSQLLERAITDELLKLEHNLRAEWERQRWLAAEAVENYVDMSELTFHCFFLLINDNGQRRIASFIDKSYASINPAFLASYLLAVTLYLFCGLSMSHCNFVLKFQQLFSEIFLPSESSTLRPITDIRTVVKALHLERPFTSFVSCPRCHYLYGYSHDNGDSLRNVPEHCTNREHPDSEPCSRRLRKPRKYHGSTTEHPTREFLYQDMPQWVGWMYSRPDIAKLLDEDPMTRRHSQVDEVEDIWEASVLRNFLGPDGKTPFYQKPGTEGRLIFSLNMDGFNPYTNRQAGKKVSTGGIYMVCLNLPSSIRYKPENMYLVGIIPGPHEPSLHQINYLLEPLVSDLLKFWTTGFFYSHTPSHPQGRWVRCALVPLVCDLPAARQMSGFAHHRATQFCSFCFQTRDQINDLDCADWRPREPEQHRRMAYEWLNAQTKRERDYLYAKNGVRWSELLRLPYWNPIHFTVIDSMHAFFLRLLSRHCRDIWGMDVTLSDGDGPTFAPKKQGPTEDEMKEAYRILQEGTATSLKALRVAVLRKLCEEATTLDFRGRAGVLLTRLIQYVSFFVKFLLSSTTGIDSKF